MLTDIIGIVFLSARSVFPVPVSIFVTNLKPSCHTKTIGNLEHFGLDGATWRAWKCIDNAKVTVLQSVSQSILSIAVHCDLRIQAYSCIIDLSC